MRWRAAFGRQESARPGNACDVWLIQSACTRRRKRKADAAQSLRGFAGRSTRPYQLACPGVTPAPAKAHCSEPPRRSTDDGRTTADVARHLGMQNGAGAVARLRSNAVGNCGPKVLAPPTAPAHARRHGTTRQCMRMYERNELNSLGAVSLASGERVRHDPAARRNRRGRSAARWISSALARARRATRGRSASPRPFVPDRGPSRTCSHGVGHCRAGQASVPRATRGALGRIAAEGDVERLEERVHAGQQPLGSAWRGQPVTPPICLRGRTTGQRPRYPACRRRPRRGRRGRWP